MLESKIRWIYHFEKDEEMNNESCYFDTNCLQGAILYKIYKSRPDKIGLCFLKQYFTPISEKVILENIGKLVKF
jgi:hypothetical protein